MDDNETTIVIGRKTMTSAALTFLAAFAGAALGVWLANRHGR